LYDRSLKCSTIIQHSATKVKDFFQTFLKGAKSGRDYDKAKECNLSAVELGGSVAFEEANLIIACLPQSSPVMPQLTVMVL